MTNLNDLLIAVCSYYGISLHEVRSKSRKRHLVKVRRTFCYLARTHFYVSKDDILNNEEIGRMINRNGEMALYHYENQLQFNSIYQSEKAEMDEVMEKYLAGPWDDDISKRYCTSLGYLGLAYVNDMEVDCKIF